MTDCFGIRGFGIRGCDCLQTEDSVMANKGFEMQDLIVAKKVSLNIYLFI